MSLRIRVGDALSQLSSVQLDTLSPGNFQLTIVQGRAPCQIVSVDATFLAGNMNYDKIGYVYFYLNLTNIILYLQLTSVIDV